MLLRDQVPTGPLECCFFPSSIPAPFWRTPGSSAGPPSEYWESDEGQRGSRSGLRVNRGDSQAGRGSAPEGCSGHGHAISLSLSLSLSLSRSLLSPSLGGGLGSLAVFERRAMNKDPDTGGPPTPAYQKPRRPRRVSQAGCPFRVPCIFPVTLVAGRVWA